MKIIKKIWGALSTPKNFSFFSELENPHQLEKEFKNRYQNFRELLSANNQALEIIAELEEAFYSGKPISMTYLRSKCTTLTVNVYKIIQALINLSDGKYKELEKIFNQISEKLEQLLFPLVNIPQGKYVLDLSEVTLKDVDLVGNKMATLGEIKNNLKINVPDGFVITSSATMYFLKYNKLEDEINRLLTLIEDLDDLEKLYKISATIERIIRRASIPEDLEKVIFEHYQKLKKKYGDELLVAMRSSALGEDLQKFSSAGQYKTQLKVSEEALLDIYKEILASKYQSSAIIYRVQRGLREEDVVMCVGCMIMVEPKVSGVVFSCDPHDPESSYIEIYFTKGLAENLVQGIEEANYYRVDKNTGKVLLENNKDFFSLSEEEIRKIWETTLKIENYFGLPQDIEWCIDKEGKLFILQSRPLILSFEKAKPEKDKEVEEKDLLAKGEILIHKGVACGPAYVVRSDLDILAFPKGGVLVVSHALPKWASLLKKACALICEKGHSATHLAIVAKELGIPTLFGVKNITKILKNNTIITVDATHQKIYLGCCEKVLKTNSFSKTNPMIGSPVYETFKKVLDLVLPLNLTDPDSPYFKARYCKTLHDIIRFCHEKAVDEIFSLGATLKIKEKEAKKLISKTPFSWWVINLGNGFKESFDLKKEKIKLEEIESLPMKAIWEGMVAKSWEGPPPLDLKGFGSVLFWSTMRPELEPALGFEIEEKNYILVSKNFCHLCMKLGYHYTIIETYIGEHFLENYIYFHYKGGGANPERRFLRIEFIAEILEKLNFYTVVRIDDLFAHIEKKKAEELYLRLKVLGYLLIHTRQLDMIMTNPSLVCYYKTQIYQDLENLFGIKLIPEAEVSKSG